MKLWKELPDAAKNVEKQKDLQKVKNDAQAVTNMKKTATLKQQTEKAATGSRQLPPIYQRNSTPLPCAGAGSFSAIDYAKV